MEAAKKAPFWQGLSEFAANWRVRISAGILLVLILQNLLLGTVPRQIAPLTQARGLGAALLILLGLGLRSWAAGTLRKGQALTTEGPYRLCRNPLYLGSILIMGGFCVLVPHLLNVLLTVVFVVVAYGLTILREERRLALKYGPLWADYAARTPRLLPVGRMVAMPGHWSFSQWFRSREYRAALVAPLLLLGLVIWHHLS